MIRAIVVAFSMVLMMVTVCWGQHLDIKRDHQRVIHPTEAQCKSDYHLIFVTVTDENVKAKQRGLPSLAASELSAYSSEFSSCSDLYEGGDDGRGYGKASAVLHHLLVIQLESFVDRHSNIERQFIEEDRKRHRSHASKLNSARLMQAVHF